MTETDAADRGNASAWLWLSALIIIADQATKWLIVQRFELYDRIEINAVLNITRLHNTGAAFSFLEDAGGWQRWLFVALACGISIAILFWLRRLPARGQSWLALALALVLGGALGNVIDRVHLHYVVDFIQVHWGDAYFPTFNVADMSITAGAALLVFDSFFGSGRSEASAAPADDSTDSG